MSCVVCHEECGTSSLCHPCEKSYDRWRDSDANTGDTFSLIVWASSRTRRVLNKACRDENGALAAGIRMAADFAAHTGMVFVVDIPRFDALAKHIERKGGGWEDFALGALSRKAEKP